MWDPSRHVLEQLGLVDLLWVAAAGECFHLVPEG